MLKSEIAIILIALVVALVIVGELQSDLGVSFDAKVMLVLVLVPAIAVAFVGMYFIPSCILVAALSLISIKKRRNETLSLCLAAWALPLWICIVAVAIEGKGNVGISTSCIANDSLFLLSSVLFLVAFIRVLRIKIGAKKRARRVAGKQSQGKGKGLGAKLVGIFKANPALAFCTCFGAVAIGVFLIAVFFA